MRGSLVSESAFREEANGDDKRTCVLCKWLGMMQCRHLYMCNAVAKLNELRKFDEFYLSYKKGVAIPCWILSARRRGNST